MYIERELSKEVQVSAGEYPIVAVLGPRQTGKTTLVKKVFPNKPYISLENIDTRTFAQQDPRGFLNQYAAGAIIDEVQRVPELFSYLQGEVDRDPTCGRFILTGSHQFQLHENISQSLAGRVSILTLLPLSYSEIASVKIQVELEELLFSGFYPRIHSEKIRPHQWLSNYLVTYVDKDVRLIKNIENLGLFSTFLKACASRVGLLLSLESIGNDIGISQNTAKSWISILESSFIACRIYPHHVNFNKRLIKTPKIYFYDTGLLCHLLGLTDLQQWPLHPLKGGIFENFIIMEVMKFYHNRGLKPPLYFWRDKSGHEIDLLVDTGLKLIPMEIKSGQTINTDYFKNLNYWKKISKSENRSYVLYAGEQTQERTEFSVLPWRKLENFFEAL